MNFFFLLPGVKEIARTCGTAVWEEDDGSFYINERRIDVSFCEKLATGGKYKALTEYIKDLCNDRHL